jgi:histidinol-phosphate aminotransferase
MRAFAAVRNNVLEYQRDTYLGSAIKLNPRFAVIDCATGFSQWGVSALAIQAHKDFDPRALAAYPELQYDKLLKPVIMERFKVVGLREDCLFFGHGSFNLAERLIHKMIKPSCMLGPGPQFNEIPSEFVAAGGRYHPVPIDPTSTDPFPVEDLEQLLEMEDASVLYIDNPNNPLGYLVELPVIARLVKAAEKRDIIVIVDEAYGDFVADDKSAAHLVPEFRNLVVIRSFSKALGLAAARVGYMFLSEELASYYRQLDVPFEPSLYPATLAQATIKDGAFIEGIRAVVARTKERVTHSFLRHGWDVLASHRATSILTVHRDGSNVVEELASIGISVEPGSAFKATHSQWDDSYCRVRIPPEDQIEELDQRLALLSVPALR